MSLEGRQPLPRHSKDHNKGRYNTTYCVDYLAPYSYTPKPVIRQNVIRQDMTRLTWHLTGNMKRQYKRRLDVPRSRLLQSEMYRF